MTLDFSGRQLKRFERRIAAVLVSMILLSTVSVFLMGFVPTQELLIYDGEFVKHVATQKASVEQVLEENNIFLGSKDRMDCDMTTSTYDVDEIHIYRAFPITLVVAGEAKQIFTSQDEVWKVLTEEKVELSQYDEVYPEYLESTYKDMTITVDKITRVVEGYEVEADYETKYIENDEQFTFYKNVISKGVKGRKTDYYEYVKKNGELIETNYVKSEMIEEPVAEVVEIGTKKAPKKITSKGLTSYGFPMGQKYKEEDFSYSRKITVEATAYDSSVIHTNSYGGYTASGMYMGYGIIAVDPRIIPLGTKLYVESPDGGKSWTYGYCIAGDTGGAIKGHRIDLFYWDTYDAIQFGRRKATVYILN